MKRRRSKTGFNKLLGSDVTLLSRDRLLGVLELDTDGGSVEVVMNRVVAERLMESVVEFLQAGEDEDSPRFAVERSQ